MKSEVYSFNVGEAEVAFASGSRSVDGLHGLTRQFIKIYGAPGTSLIAIGRIADKLEWINKLETEWEFVEVSGMKSGYLSAVVTCN